MAFRRRNTSPEDKLTLLRQDSCFLCLLRARRSVQVRRQESANLETSTKRSPAPLHAAHYYFCSASSFAGDRWINAIRKGQEDECCTISSRTRRASSLRAGYRERGR